MRNPESRHFILEVSGKHQRILTNPNLWLAKLDRVYEAYADLVGGVPYRGRKIKIHACTEHWPRHNFWAAAGNPIHWRPQYIASAFEQVNQGDWLFGIVHEIGHNFDGVHADGKEEYVWVWDGEFSSNWKMVYVIEQIPDMVVWTNDGKRYGSQPDCPHIKDFFREKARESGESERMVPGCKDDIQILRQHNDPATYHFIELKERIGWEPFKDTYANLRVMPRYRIPESPIALFRFFIKILCENTRSNTDPEEFLKQRGFPL